MWHSLFLTLLLAFIAATALAAGRRIPVLIFLLAAAFFAVATAKQLRPSPAARRRKAGHCTGCGYDLRETPHRCPECGQPTSEGEFRDWIRAEFGALLRPDPQTTETTRPATPVTRSTKDPAGPTGPTTGERKP